MEDKESLPDVEAVLLREPEMLAEADADAALEALLLLLWAPEALPQEVWEGEREPELLEEVQPLPDSEGLLRLLTLALGVPDRLTVAQELAEAELLRDVVVEGVGAPGPVTEAVPEPEGQEE